MIKVMFVCLGNICRSPMAEAILAHKAEARFPNKIYVESSGTAAYHIGEAPDPRTVSVLRSNGIPTTHKAQQLTSAHLNTFDYIIVMDKDNLQNAQKIAPGNTIDKLHLMRGFDKTDNVTNVKDPWYGNHVDFEECYDVLDRSIDAFLHFLVEKGNLTD